LRIAILYSGLISRVNGTDERVLQIASGLAKQGIHVTLSASIEPPAKNPNLTNLNVIPAPRFPNFLSVFNWIAQLVSSGLTRKYDMIQIESFSSFKSLALSLLMRPFSKKSVIVFHDKQFKSDPRKSVTGRFHLILQRILLTLFDASITPGLSVKKWFEELHGNLVHEKMAVIPNGAPTLKIKENIDYSHIRKKYGVDPSFAVLFFGSMIFKPNHEDAMHLYKISNFVSSRFEKSTEKKLIFIVAGIGSKTLPKTEHFIPLGFVKKLDELISLPDVMILPHMPSYSGPHVKTMYAFLSRKPVVATEDAVKDMPYVVPRKHFLPFDVNEPNSLLNALLNIHKDRELQKSLVTNAFQYTENFSWKRISLLHLKFYESLLNQL
jgi:glycosyltransferase involved in cell wall biosynthesis